MVRLAIMLLVLSAPLAAAQGLPRGIDLQSPKMTEAELTREELATLLQADGAADLAGMRLNRLDLSGLDLTGANLRAASLNDADLSGAILDGAVLSQAWMIGATLSGASLRGAELFQTQLWGADLTGADLTGARAPAIFNDARIAGAVFREADLSADMRNQSMGLMRAVFQGADGQEADFTGAKLGRADLQFADLRGAVFRDADLSFADLGGADLTGADVTGTEFSEADVTSARLVGLIGAEPAELERSRNLSRAIRE
jgi:uncharacterized protein YjbI with pentapeptide repeats